MQLFSIFLVMILSSPAWSESLQCQKQAESLVKQLEGVLVDIEGFAQGDFDEYQFETTVVSKNENGVTLKVVSAHENEDLEGWTQEYQVEYATSGDSCYIVQYSYLGAASNDNEQQSEEDCIELSAAEKYLEKSFQGKYNSVPVDDFYWLDEENEDFQITPQLVKTAVDSLVWNSERSAYKTDVLFNDYCAAGAECWGGYTVSCQGDIDVWIDGED
jgi:hypothetical protein